MLKHFINTLIDRFNMLWFIMALGLGGTSVAGFAILNYTFQRPEGAKGLVHPGMIEPHLGTMGAAWSTLYAVLSNHILLFGALHVIVLLTTFGLYAAWRRRPPEAYRALLEDNTRNSAIIAPALAVGMTFNVFLVGGWFNVPWFRAHMQDLMGYAFAAWLLILAYAGGTALRIQRRHLEHGFDVLKMHFGWLLVPFALAMTAVSGAGIAALAHDPAIAKAAFFLSLGPFSMAAFLTAIKLISVFRSQYRLGLPEKIEFLPSFLIVIPIVTLLSITLYRYGHFAAHQLPGQIPAFYYAAVTGGVWAFELWYALLGVALLGGYLKRHLFTLKYFDESQWGLICPMVAMAVLGAFVYKTLLPSPWVLWGIVGMLVLDVTILAWMALRQYRALVQRNREALEARQGIGALAPAGAK